LCNTLSIKVYNQDTNLTYTNLDCNHTNEIQKWIKIHDTAAQINLFEPTMCVQTNYPFEYGKQYEINSNISVVFYDIECLSTE